MAKTAKKKKKQSQAYVALVYFVTLLFFICVFGAGGYYLIDRYGLIKGIGSSENDDENSIYNKNTTTLFVNPDKDDNLNNSVLVRFIPANNEIIVVPLSKYVVAEYNSVTDTLENHYNSRGITYLKKTIEQSFGIKIDYYMTITDSAFDDIANLCRGILYTPGEDLYYLGEDDNDSVSLERGVGVALEGKNIRLIMNKPVFSEGPSGNVKAASTFITQLINNAYAQDKSTISNLDEIFSTFKESGETNLSKTTFHEIKKVIIKTLQETNAPATSMSPTGTWTDDKHFEISSDFPPTMRIAFKENND